MIPTDYHLHSTHSADSRATLAEMCEAAIEAGLKDVCFAEHLDFDRDDPHYGFFDYEAYAEAVAEAQSRYGDRLTIRMGVEFDFRRAYGVEPGECLAAMDFDFVMGSVHTTGGVHIYGLTPEGLDDLDIRALQAEYFDETAALVASGWCHCLGHFDYIYKQAPGLFEAYRNAWYWERVEKILAECVARGVVLEVNTHHVLDRGMALAADLEVLKRYRRLGGRRVAVGSDAHRPEDVAHAYAEAERALRAAGFTEATGFQAGRPYSVALED
ncbi:MAG: histidinol-phosphatase HisJ family protein [Phycisphaerae bacterium]